MSMLVVGGVATVAMISIRWLRRRWLVVVVWGHSMEPTLWDGDRVLVHRRSPDRINRGDVVVLRPPVIHVPLGAGRWRAADGGLQVKRIAAVAGDPIPVGIRCDEPRIPTGTLVVVSDNLEAGYDSRHWGPYVASGLIGVVVRRLGGGAGR